ncbi:MAG TPA: exodeoxyribonuclease VII small subunit [Anaerolineaceae bacterium]|nr:exodeoxyribonuclease VII small subunit [Anaerolineaceae bacterium]
MDKNPVEELSYELAFAELQEIVNRLEIESLSLEESLSLYERGQALSKRCSSLLVTAELRVQQLKLDGIENKDE